MTLLSLFLWKNFKYVKFHWKWITLLLIGCVALLTILLHTTDSFQIIKEQIYEAEDEEIFLPTFGRNKICFAPKISEVFIIMKKVQSKLFVIPEGVETDKLQSCLDENPGSFGILFDTCSPPNPERALCRYSIISKSSKVSAADIYYNDKEVLGNQVYDDYLRSGFFAVQYSTDLGIMYSLNMTENYNITVARVPSIRLENIDSSRLTTFGIYFALFLFVLLLNTFLVPLVEEKHTGIQGYLSTSMFHGYLNISAFYLINLIIYILFMLVSISIGYYYKALGTIGFLYVGTLFLLFLLSAMAYTVLISVIFNSVYYAKVGGFVFYFIPTLIFELEKNIFAHVSYLLSGNTFLKGMEIFQLFTNKKRDFTYNNISTRITEDSFTLLEIYLAQVAQTIVYTCLYYYFSNLFPGEGGVPKRYYFLLLRLARYFRKMKKFDKKDIYEDIPLFTSNLCKRYIERGHPVKEAVSFLTMKAANNEITVLLGHNGAGKTTLINMIIGAVDISSGNVYVFGKPNVAEYRKDIGYCPQHNIFIKYLTCMEHLYFFARLRGLNHFEATEDASNLLSELLLKDKCNEGGDNLSGGMKRRMLLGMAIAGKTKLAILDEPTSGLDPESRRTLWNILLKMRKTRAILLTTHHMEEAEILADMVYIMSNGQMINTGTVMDLKAAAHVRYTVKLLTNEKFQPSVLSALWKQYLICPLPKMSEPLIKIPLLVQQSHKYIQIIKALEDNMTELGVVTFSVTCGTLEDVFLETIDSVDSANDINKYIPFQKPTANPTRSIGLLFNQICAVGYKKAIYIRRNLSCLLMFLIPIWTILIGIYFMLSDTKHDKEYFPVCMTQTIPNYEIYANIPEHYQAFRYHLKDEIESRLGKFIPTNKTIENELLEIQRQNLTHFYDYVFGAVEIIHAKIPEIKILYSGNIIHSSSKLLNIINNVILRENSKTFNIDTSNMPLKESYVLTAGKLEYFNSLVPIGFFFYMLFYITLPFRENQTGFKNMESISCWWYWICHMFFDSTTHIIVCVISVLLTRLAISEELYYLVDNDVLNMFVWYGLVYLPIIYIFANTFKSLSNLSTCLSLLFMVSTILPIITSGNQESLDKYSTLINILLVLPDFALKHWMMLYNQNHIIVGQNKYFFEEMPYKNGYSIYAVLSIGLIECILLQLFLIHIWDNIYKKELLCRIFSLKHFFKNATEPDESVCELEHVVRDIDARSSNSIDEEKEPILMVHNLNKTYDNRVHAVRGIDFCVNSGECFGLLGLNGAGKSTTFEMLTGNETITKGNVSLKGINVRREIDWYKYLLGYCPQSDAINGFMTPEQILRYMGKIRGIPNSKIRQEMYALIDFMQLMPFKDTQIYKLSGGTKRKVNTAMALIGMPTIVFLDEPTTGVDPESRRFIWQLLKYYMLDKTRAVVLTTHSMEECEYLCDKIAIMAAGKIKCMDYIPKLREEFGIAYTIKIKVPSTLENPIKKIKPMMDAYFKCFIREQHNSTITFTIKEKPIIWSSVFIRMEELITDHPMLILKYLIAESSLEDIFFNVGYVTPDIE